MNSGRSPPPTQAVRLAFSCGRRSTALSACASPNPANDGARAAREYALARGLNPETLTKFGVGWSPRDGNPLLQLSGPNCLVTPHIAWASEQAMASLAEEVVCNIEAFYAGESRNRVV